MPVHFQEREAEPAQMFWVQRSAAIWKPSELNGNQTVHIKEKQPMAFVPSLILWSIKEILFLYGPNNPISINKRRGSEKKVCQIQATRQSKGQGGPGRRSMGRWGGDWGTEKGRKKTSGVKGTESASDNRGWRQNSAWRRKGERRESKAEADRSRKCKGRRNKEWTH